MPKTIQELETELTATYHALAASQQEVEAVLRGQESLKAQTVRIRQALGGGVSGQDTEDLARDVVARLVVEIAENDRLRASLALAQKDGERLDWLEAKANGYPVEVDAFTGLKDPATDAVFVTHYPATGEEVPDAQNVIHPKPHRLGQGRTLREAIDAASRPSETTREGE